MWCYKIVYYSDGSYFNAEGLVAGLTMIEAIRRLKSYYGINAFVDVHMTATESGDGVLDFDEFLNVEYTTFFPEEN